MKDKTAYPSLAVVIVTHNRLPDLKETLRKFLAISDDFSHLIVINNASSDGTSDFLKSIAPEFNGKLIYKNLDLNSGGAGGFHEGVKMALDLNIEWIWMSDDDAMPDKNTLKCLLKLDKSTNNIYGSTAIALGSTDDELCWPYKPISYSAGKSSRRKKQSDMPELEELDFVPFLGLMISVSLVKQIGLPNKAYFISGDDVEYCIRAKSKGAKCIIVKNSNLYHPAIPIYTKTILSYEFRFLRLPPWRRTYDVRNRIWNAKLKSGDILAILVAFSIVLRLLFSLTSEKNKLEQVKSYFAGIFQGLFNYSRTGNEKGILKKPIA